MYAKIQPLLYFLSHETCMGRSEKKKKKKKKKKLRKMELFSGIKRN